MSLNPKRKSILCHKLICLSQLTLECLDELNPTTKGALLYRDNLIKIIEELNNNIADTNAILKTTYFNDISKKIDTILRINFNSDM